jgi:hypothetical protein
MKARVDPITRESYQRPPIQAIGTAHGLRADAFGPWAGAFARPF